MGVTFCAVAPEHPLAAHAAASRAEVAAFIAECAQGGTTEAELATQDKKGVATGLFVQHPLTGEPVEVWVGNYVLIGYGDGAVMGVPAHDERDFAFAKKYGLAIQPVIAVDDRVYSTESWAEWYADKQRGRCIDSGVLDGLACKPAVDRVAELLAAKGLGEKKTTWRLRDWGISRQRYWGTPIPIIHCPEHGAVPVPDADLPVVLPEDCIPDGSGNPLNQREDFLRCACPVCGAPSRRETDTMDTFVDSSWYFMRYCDPHDDQAMVGEGARHWMPMDQYTGGIEHAILHLLYARFWTKVMRDIGLIAVGEPFTRLMTQGMVLNHIYSRRSAQGGIDYFWPQDVENRVDDTGRITGATLKADGSAVDYDGVGTMSKSKNNGVDPQALIDQCGADTARLFVMFASPPEQTLEWNDAGVEGANRFLRRVWGFGARHREAIGGAGAVAPGALAAAAKSLRREVHSVLRQVSYDYERMQYNTVASGAMKLLNALETFARPSGAAPDGSDAVLREGFGILLRVLYPACPHITHILWQELGYAAALGDLLDAPWPAVDESALLLDEIELMLQVGGKLRGSLKLPASADKAAIEAAALASAEFLRFAEGRPAKKVVIVPGRLVNVVV
jgi:leucyl-tRNA synthetase